jgi:4-hydroxybenzoyl-CoA reductase beta subunit
MIDRHKGKVSIVAGGTDMINRLRHRLVTPPFVMSLKGVAELAGVTKKGANIVISAGTTLRDVIESPLVAAYAPGLVQAARLVAAPPIQNIATIGGNILQNTRCLFYDQSELVRKAAEPCLKQGGKVCLAVKGSRKCFSVYQGDMAPLLIALDAKVTLKSPHGRRTILLTALFTGNGKEPFAIKKDEILTDISVPVPKGTFGSAYEKLRLRKGLEYPLVSAAAFIALNNRGVISQARVVLGAAGPGPKLLEPAAAALIGKKPEETDIDAAASDALKAAQMADNLALPADYRRKMAKVFTARAIAGALQNVQKAGS